MGSGFSHLLWRKFHDYPGKTYHIGCLKVFAADGHRFLEDWIPAWLLPAGYSIRSGAAR